MAKKSSNSQDQESHDLPRTKYFVRGTERAQSSLPADIHNFRRLGFEEVGSKSAQTARVNEAAKAAEADAVEGPAAGDSPGE